MRKKLEKYIKFAGGIVILGISLLVYQWVSPESFLAYEGQVVELKELQANPIEDYAGKPAGESIPRLTGKDEFEQLRHKGYATITTDEIIPTGIYGLISQEAYNILQKGVVRVGGRVRRKTNIVEWAKRWPLMDAQYYQEYYLVRLPDSTYILALLSPGIEKEFRTKGEITLPIGRKETIRNEVRTLFTDICSKYEVEPVYYLFMVDNAWIEEKRGILFILRFIPAAGVFFILASGWVMIMGKIFHIED